jgi:hypothetical protein
MSARLVLTAEAQDLVETFTAELVTIGATPWPSTISGARSFCARYPIPTTFSAQSVEEQIRLSSHQRRFACWLMVTARMRVSAQFLARADLRLGATAARHYPGLHARFVATATTLGSDRHWQRLNGQPWRNWPRCTACASIRSAPSRSKSAQTPCWPLLLAPDIPRRGTYCARPWFGCAPPSFTRA